MPIFQLSKELIFPPVELALDTGILAVGGDLSAERLLLAYRNGIFPWYSEDEPIIWWSPDPRYLLFPEDLKISRSMRQVLKRKTFRFTFDTEFKEVMFRCRHPRKNQEGTWITDEMIAAYCLLHEMGYAHSVEAWHADELVGGLYGISLGRCFFGESMFTRMSNASKAAFIFLVKRLEELDFRLIDCQVYTRHLESLGASELPRNDFLDLLGMGLKHETIVGNWGDIL